MSKLKIKKLHENAILPRKAHASDACFDLFAVDARRSDIDGIFEYSTGIAIEIPDGYYGQILTRSSMAKLGLVVVGGVIDAGYRGEIKIMINVLQMDEFTQSDEMNFIMDEYVVDKPVAQLAIHTPVRISLGRPKFRLEYEIAGSIELLMPTSQMLTITDEKTYRKLYFELLDRRGWREIIAALRSVAVPGKETLLLCFEDVRQPNTFCHRRIFADWIEWHFERTIDELDEADTCALTQWTTIMPIVHSTSTTDFTQLPNAILMDGTLSMAAFRVWAVGMSHAKSWIFRQCDLATKCGVSVNTLKNALDELRERGYVTGEFRRENDPLTFYDSVNEANPNCQNLIVHDSENCQNLIEELSKSDSSNCQNLIANNIKNNIKTIHPESELGDSAFIAREATSETETLTLTFSADRDFSDVESPRNLIEVQPFPDAEWRAFVSLWNDSGLPRYTALAPSSMDVVNFRSLVRRYGRDGPSRLCEKYGNSPWLRKQKWSLSRSIREDLATKIIDGDYEKDFAKTPPKRSEVQPLPTQEDYAKGFFHGIRNNDDD